ncbi:reverse transcriptase-like protein [Candidatus Saccharibacteria bacterium]|nr:reverse transcriptase-like protein [Candidatus Saccharibacteria bacterium]
MKQRIRVVGIVREDDKLLLVRNSRGRAEELPTWELPTGKIRFGEQPEEAMSQLFFEHLGAQVKELRLVDAITFIGLPGASQLGNLYIVFEVDLDGEIKLQASEKYSAYKFVTTEEIRELKVDEATLAVLEIEGGRKIVPTMREERRNETEALVAATIYFDGASRGNPGPAGVGYVVVGENGEVLKRGGEFIGFATSRTAEYYALKEACEQGLELGLKRVRFVGDNLMVINQMNGIFQVKNQDLMTVHEDVLKLIAGFDKVAFEHVVRAENTEADLEANKAIDEHFGNKTL